MAMSAFDDMLEAPEEAAHESFQVDSMDTATWAGRKLAETLHQRADLEAWAKREKARIDAVVLREANRLEGTEAFFTSHLVLYLRRLIDAGRKTRSLDLPSGRLSLRVRKPKIHIENDHDLIAWAKANEYSDLIRVKEEVDRRALSERVVLREGGRVFDGATDEPIAGLLWEAQEDIVSFAPVEESPS